MAIFIDIYVINIRKDITIEGFVFMCFIKHITENEYQWPLKLFSLDSMTAQLIK